MIYSSRDSNTQIEPLQNISSAPKNFRKAYLSALLLLPTLGPLYLKELTLLDNKLYLKKYYPKKVTSAISVSKRFLRYVKACTKNLKHLRIRNLRNIKSSTRAIKSLEIFDVNLRSIYNVSQFKRAMIASKALETIKIQCPPVEQIFRNIRYAGTLRSLSLKLANKHLPSLTDGLLNLCALESVSLLFLSPDSYVMYDPSRFLTFCDIILAKKSLKIFNLDFDTNRGYYSTEAFEKLFFYIEKSKIEKWRIQAMLSINDVVRLAKTYSIFSQSQHIAIHTWEHSSLDQKARKEGVTSTCCAKIESEEKSKKMLNIYLLKTSELSEEHPLDLESLLQPCTSLEYLFFERVLSFLHPIHSLNNSLIHYPLFKALYFDIALVQEKNVWEPLLQVIEKASSLERFHLHTLRDYMSEQEGELEFEFIQACLKKLTRIKTLKGLEFSIKGLSQKTLGIIQSFIANMADLKQLSYSLAYCPYRDSLAPNIPFTSLAQLTKLKLCIPYSPDTFLQRLSTNIDKLSSLQVFEFRNQGFSSILWETLQALMKKLRHLSELREFSFYTNIRFGLPGVHTISEGDVERLKNEIKKLAHQIPKLEYVKAEIVGSPRPITIEYKSLKLCF